MVPQDKSKETVLQRCWSVFSEEVVWVFLLGGPFQNVSKREEVVLLVFPFVYVACYIWCRVVSECRIWFMPLVLCRRNWRLQWCNCCLYWGLWPESLYTYVIHCWTTSQWSLLFLDILISGRAPCKILIKGSGCLPLCVKIKGVIPQSRVFQISAIWCSFEMLLLFFILFIHCVHWGVVQCTLVWFMSCDDIGPFLHWEEVFDYPLLGHCCVHDNILLYPEFQWHLVCQVYAASDVNYPPFSWMCVCLLYPSGVVEY